MSRVVRVTLDVVGSVAPDPQYEIVIGEVIRANKWRLICDTLCGNAVREDDLALPLQIVEDVFTSAVGRTIGIAQALAF